MSICALYLFSSFLPSQLLSIPNILKIVKQSCSIFYKINFPVLKISK